MIVICLVIFIYYKLIPVDDYTRSDFDVNYNNFRKENNIPILPNDWLSRHPYALLEFYNPDSISNGHIIKYINLSKSSTGAEMDVFKLDDCIIMSRFERNDKNKVLYKIESYDEKSSLFSSDRRVISSLEANQLLSKFKIDFVFDSSWDKNLKK